MKKLLIVLLIAVLVILGLFFWSETRKDAGESEPSGTLVMASVKKLGKGGSYV